MTTETRKFASMPALQRQPFVTARAPSDPRLVSRESAGVPVSVRWFFLLSIFAIPYENASFGPVSGIFILRLFMLMLCGCYLVCYGGSRQRSMSIPGWAIWCFFGYGVVYTLSVLSDEQGGVEGALTILQLLIFLYIASQLLKDPITARRALITYAVAIFITAVIALGNVPGLASEMDGRITAVGDNPNTAGQHMALAILIFLGLILNRTFKRTSRKLLVLSMTVVLLAGVAATGSRAAILALVVGCLIFSIPHYRSKRIFFPIILAILGAGATLYTVATNPEFVDRWRATYYEGDSAGRDLIYGAALQMVLERPVLGWHPVSGFYELGNRLGLSTGRDVHNLLLDLFLGLGIIGAAPFFCGLASCFRGAWRGRAGIFGMLPAALITANIIASLFHTNVFWKVQWLVFALAIASRPKHFVNFRHP